MKNVKILKTSNTVNIGDNIQSIAVAQHIEQSYTFVERDFLSKYSGKECVVIMNGWFSHKPENWPPSDQITPVFFGFHMTPETAKSYKSYASYFMEHGPVGCRDEATARILEEWGVPTEVTGCATMTFPTREKTQSQTFLVAIDVDRSRFAKKDRAQITFGSHDLNFSLLKNDTKLLVAKDMLEFYKNHASSIITTKIHCAMPCFAMGIPTIYCGPSEPRTDVVKLIGLRHHRLRLAGRQKMDEFQFDYPDFEHRKAQITASLKQRLSDIGILVKPNTNQA